MKYAVIIITLLLTNAIQRAGAGTKMVTETNKDAVVRAECINTSTGLTVGFRIEIMNHSQDKNFMFVLRDISYLFNVRLINENGVDISPLMSPLSSDKWGPNTPLKHNYESILLGTNRFWFVPVPSQVRADLMKFTNNNNLMPTPDGKYMTEIRISIEYFMQDKAEKSIPKSPKFQSLHLTLPRIPIVVDSKLLGQNLEDIYLKGSKSEAENQSSVSTNDKPAQ